MRNQNNLFKLVINFFGGSLRHGDNVKLISAGLKIGGGH